MPSRADAWQLLTEWTAGESLRKHALAVEAAVRQGWERYIGEYGGFVGMDGFGASGSVPDLYDHCGITPRKVADEVKARI